MKTEFLRRNYNFEIRAEKKEGEENKGKYTLYGLPIVFDSRTDIGYFDEIIEKGALDKTDLKDVRFLVNHDLSKIPLARSRNNNENSTMRLKKTDKGLEVEIDLDADNNSEARNLYSAITRGDISGMSFMFGIAEERWEDENTDYPKRFITKIDPVIEVSAVNFPAYTSTSINARGDTITENDRAALEKMRETCRAEAEKSAKYKMPYDIKKLILQYGGNVK